MSRSVLFAPLLVVAFALPSPALAQSAEPFPSFERTERDLGTWDAVLVGKDAEGRIVTARGVETNTSSCGGTCVETRLGGILAVPPRLGRNRAWWEGVAQPGLDNFRTGQSQTARVSGESPDTRVVDILPTPAMPDAQSSLTIAAPPSRISVDYPAPRKRVVTLYGRSNGGERQLLRITYTRRD